MKILVTGGAGFIGSHLTDKLIRQGHKVAVLDNLSAGTKENVNPKAKFYKIDIRDSKISQVFRREKPETVFHYAAQIDVRKSMEDPVEDADINILGTLNILENCREYKAKKIIFISSAGVYGDPKKLPVTENHPLNPIAPYPITKLTIEKYLNYYRSRGLDYVALRYPNVYGPRQQSSGEAGVVAIFIERIIKGKRQVIFGDGEQIRDFLYVDDAVSAAIKSMKAPSGSVYNVGTNKEITINRLLNLISDILEKEAQPIFKPVRQGEIIRSKMDYSKIKKELGWQPKYILGQGLKETVQWFKKRYYGRI